MTDGAVHEAGSPQAEGFALSENRETQDHGVTNDLSEGLLIPRYCYYYRRYFLQLAILDTNVCLFFELCSETKLRLINCAINLMSSAYFQSMNLST